jgi:hypothetical protein
MAGDGNTALETLELVLVNNTFFPTQTVHGLPIIAVEVWAYVHVVVVIIVTAGICTFPVQTLKNQRFPTCQILDADWYQYDHTDTSLAGHVRIYVYIFAGAIFGGSTRTK